VVKIMGRLVLASHLSVAELFERYRSASEGRAKSHYQIIWLLSGGKTIAECAAATGYSERWITKLVHRYNAGGPESLGDRRRGNGGRTPLLTPEQLADLAAAVSERPSDGGLWTGAKVAKWIAGKTGRERVPVKRGWVYLRRLDMTWQMPRPAHAQGATEEERAAYKKNSRRPWIKRARQIRRPRLKSGLSTNTASG
jgi:transposase